MGRLIVFVGPVGSGKTTQMGFIAKKFRSEHLNVYVSCIKPSFQLTQKFEQICTKCRLEEKTVEHLLKLITSIELILNSLLLLPLMFFKIEVKRLFYSRVLIEEHALGSIIDYIHIVRLYKIKKLPLKRLVNLIFPFAGKADTTILLSTDVATLNERWNIRGSQPEHLEYINLQYKVFQSNNPVKGAFQVPSSKSIEEVGQQIYDIINRQIVKN